MRLASVAFRAALLLASARAQAPDLPTSAERLASLPEGVVLGYTNEPKLARSTVTNMWLNRDRTRVEATVSGQLIDRPRGVALEGSVDEIADQAHLTRHGLFRRVDSKFAQFVPREVEEDGYGLWRTWESHGFCPAELLIRDPWGTIAWEAPSHDVPVTAAECSWILRPGMYRQQGYVMLSSAPVAVQFRTMSLLAGVEHIDVYDGAHAGAHLIARYTGRKVPEQVSSSGAEMRIVYWVDLNRTAASAWDEIESALSAGKLTDAVRCFGTMARFGTVGFFRQDARRALETVAIGLSRKPQHRWMRRKWFGRADGFAHAYRLAAAMLSQDEDLWQKRHRHDPGKEDEPWDAPLSPRRWPEPLPLPEQNPNYYDDSTGKKALDFVPTMEGIVRHREPSGFSFDFTTSADCRGKGIATEGDAMLPPLTVTGNPHRNYKFLPFPLEPSSCQLQNIDGPQVTIDRPFTIVESLMKTAAEDEMRYCLDGSCNPMSSGLTAGGGNCTTACAVFLECVDLQIANYTQWAVPGKKNLYNKSLVAAARDVCFQSSEAEQCTAVYVPNTADPDDLPISIDNPKSMPCLHLDCFYCGKMLYERYFNCAIDCGKNITHPSGECSDCSYNFQDMYDEIDMTRYKVFHAYFVGAIGLVSGPDSVCSSECDLLEPGMLDADIPMSEECRQCHYPIEDFINTDHEDCLHGMQMRCVSLDRGLYNFMQDVYHVLKDELLGMLLPTGEGSYGAYSSYGGGSAAAVDGADAAASADGDAAADGAADAADAGGGT